MPHVASDLGLQSLLMTLYGIPDKNGQRQVISLLAVPRRQGVGRVERWCWVNFQCRGVLLIWMLVGQGPNAAAEGAAGGCLNIFLSTVISLSFLPLSGRRPDIDGNTVSKSC